MTFLPNLLLPEPKIFGISIGRTTVRGIEVDDKGAVIAMSEINFPTDVFQNASVIHNDKLIESLKNMRQQGKFTTPYVAVCFPEIFAYSREYAVPIIPDEDIAEAVSWHVKDLFPFPENEIYFDWKIVEGGIKEYKVSVVAVQRKLLDDLVMALETAGLKPLSFEPGASVIAGLLELKTGESVLVTEVSRRGAYVTLVQSDKALFTTVVNVTPDDTSETYLTNIKKTIGEISAYFKSKGALDEKTTRVVLTGELATPEWQRAASTFFPYPTDILKSKAPGPAFNNAFALATRKPTSPSDIHTINLLPRLLQEGHEIEQKTTLYQILLARTAAFLFIICVCSFLAYFFVNIQKAQVDSALKKLNAELSAQGASNQGLLQLNSRAKQVVELAPLRKTPADYLEQLKSMLPAGISITEWEYSDSTLQFSITGIAKSRDDLLALKDTFDSSDTFGKVSLPLGSLESPQNIQFSLAFVLKK
jgi:hypothetical protein